MIKKLAPFFFLLLALALYAPALRAGFVWDDRALVLGDPLIRSWHLGWEGFQHFLFTDATASSFYRPLQRLSYLGDYAAFVFAPAGYHLDSILWHAAAAMALFFFAEELLRFCEMEKGARVIVAFVGALVWMVHPVQSAAVAYIAGRADPLAAAFGFLGLFLGLRLLRADDLSRWLLACAAALAMLASALSKEMGLLFLPLWLILLLARRERRPLWGELAIIPCVLIVYLSLRLPAEKIALPVSAAAAPLLVRPIVIARAVAEYAGLLLCPIHLHMDRDVETHPFGFVRASLDAAAWRELQTLLGVILIAALFYALWRSRRQRAVFLPLLFAAVTYLPVSGIVSLNASVAEHWLYLPSAFLFLAGAAALAAAGWLRSRLLLVCLTTWLLLLSARTFARAQDWKDQRIFLTRTIAAGGDSARMWINLGVLELNENHLTAARNDLEQALLREPENPLALLNLGIVATRERNFAQARQLLQKVTEPPALAAEAQENLAILENRESGRINLLRLRLATRLGPMNWSIEKRYIETLATLGQPALAIRELKSSLAAAPYRAESWEMMSRLLRTIGRPNDAALAEARAAENDVHLHEHESRDL